MNGPDIWEWNQYDIPTVATFPSKHTVSGISIWFLFPSCMHFHVARGAEPHFKFNWPHQKERYHCHLRFMKCYLIFLKWQNLFCNHLNTHSLRVFWFHHFPTTWIKTWICERPWCLEKVPNIFSQMVVQNVDESHGTIHKNNSLNTSTKIAAKRHIKFNSINARRSVASFLWSVWQNPVPCRGLGGNTAFWERKRKELWLVGWCWNHHFATHLLVI